MKEKPNYKDYNMVDFDCFEGSADIIEEKLDKYFKDRVEYERSQFPWPPEDGSVWEYSGPIKNPVTGHEHNLIESSFKAEVRSGLCNWRQNFLGKLIVTQDCGNDVTAAYLTGLMTRIK